MTTELMTAPVAVEPIILTPDQQAKYDVIRAWLAARDPRHNDNLGKPQQEAPQKLREIIGGWDNPDDYHVLEGYAGVGKSELLAKLVVDLSEEGWFLAVAAPTNKAVAVIQTKVQQRAGSRVIAADFGSVHSFSGLHLVETDDGEHRISSSGQGRISRYNLLIVDEGSMVDREYQLRAISESRGPCLVLFVGDPCQLPPVKEGSVSLVFSFPQKQILTEVTRQARGNPLIAASIKVREKMKFNERVEVSDLMEWLPDCMVRGTRNIVPALIDYQRNNWDARGICWRNQTVLQTNEDVHWDLYPDDGKMIFSAGERVIVQSACVARDMTTGEAVDLATSEELVILDVERTKHPDYQKISCYLMVMQDDLGQEVMVYVPTLISAIKHASNELFGKLREAKEDYDHSGTGRAREAVTQARAAAWKFKKAFAEIRHTYCLTSHKSQGSTIDYAMVNIADLQMNPSTFEYNRSLYVAMTRPRHSAFFYY